MYDDTRAARWEVNLPDLEQLRAPAALEWVKTDGKPADRPLGTHLLKCAFDASLIACIVAANYAQVIRLLVRTWPDLLTRVLREAGWTVEPPRALTGVSDTARGQRLARMDAR